MNILYGIVGEGLGHATRSKAVIDYLKKKHKVHVFTSNKAFTFLKDSLDNVHETEGLYIWFSGDSISFIKTFFKNLVRFPKIVWKNISTLRKLRKSFRPDLIITDFDSFSWFVGKIYRIPIISIDNIHVLTETTMAPVPGKGRFFNTLITRLRTPFSKKYIITSFFKATPKEKKALLVPPILREQILKAKPLEGKHILVYQTSESFRLQLLSAFTDLDEKFIVYGFNEEKTIQNIIFKKYKKQGFIEDLRKAKGVITNGGFSLITESLHLHKPILSLPIHKHYEQFMNAYFLEKLGYGKNEKEINKKILISFLKSLKKFEHNLKSYPRNDNTKLFDWLDSYLGE